MTDDQVFAYILGQEYGLPLYLNQPPRIGEMLDLDAMVQGIVDCAFTENGEWVLIDYKTDYDTAPEVFVPRHEMQMNWYREALERLTRIPVKEMWLHALRVGRAFPVERREL